MRDDFEPINLGRPDVDEPVTLVRAGSAAVLVPRSLSRLSGRQVELARDIQRTALRIHELQDALDAQVLDGRDGGLSWGAIGWSVGTTSDAARRRWSE